MDRVKGDPIKSLPNYYELRNRLVRVKFDTMEKEIETELSEVLRKAAELRNVGRGTVACLLDEFTRNCVSKVVTALKELLREFE